MRVPYSWLREVVDAGAPGWDVSPDELEQTFIRIGHEVEEIIPVGPITGPLTIGRVSEIEELTEFKRPIRAVKVDVGEPHPRSPPLIWRSRRPSSRPAPKRSASCRRGRSWPRSTW